MSELSSAADPVQLGTPNSEIHLPSWGLESATIGKNGYIALTQPHVDRLRSNFTRWYSVAPWKLRICQPLLGSNPRWRTTFKFLIYGPDIVLTAKARNFKFGLCIDDEEYF